MFINSSCLDLLLIELVPMAHRLAHELSVSASDTGGGLHDHSSSTSSSSQQKQLSSAAQEKQQQGTTLDEEDEREAVFLRLESLGYRVGLGLVERYICLSPFSYLLIMRKSVHDISMLLYC